MKTIRILLVFMITGTLVACATSPVPVSEAKAVPSNRVISTPSIRSSEAQDLAKITVIRDSGALGSAGSFLLSIDSQEIALFRTKEMLTIDVYPGEHLVTLVPKPNFGAPINEYEFNINAGEHRYYRLSFTKGGILFQRSSLIQ